VHCWELACKITDLKFCSGFARWTTIFANLLLTRIVSQDYGPPSTAVKSVFWSTSLSMRRMFPSRVLALHNLLQRQRPSNAVRKSTYPSSRFPHPLTILSQFLPYAVFRTTNSLSIDSFMRNSSWRLPLVLDMFACFRVGSGCSVFWLTIG